MTLLRVRGSSTSAIILCDTLKRGVNQAAAPLTAVQETLHHRAIFEQKDSLTHNTIHYTTPHHATPTSNACLHVCCFTFTPATSSGDFFPIHSLPVSPCFSGLSIALRSLDEIYAEAREGEDNEHQGYPSIRPKPRQMTRLYQDNTTQHNTEIGDVSRECIGEARYQVSPVISSRIAF